MTDEGLRDALWARRFHFVAIGGVTVILAAVVGVAMLAGPLEAVVYLVLFGVGVGLVPAMIALGAPSFPRAMRGIVGSLTFTLGQLANGIGILVQHQRGWQMHAGRRRDDGTLEVYLDDHGWQPVIDDELTRLGWAPFGIMLDTVGQDLREYRVDTGELSARENGSSLPDDPVDWSVVPDQPTTTDGGTGVERGGFHEVSTPAPPDDGWVLDLKQVWTRGLAKVGDVALFEKVEEVTMRKQAKQSRSSGYGAVVGTIVGLVLGILTGYVMLGG